MLKALVFRYRAERDLRLPRSNGYQVFSALCGFASGEISRCFRHHEGGVPPYTVSDMQPGDGRAFAADRSAPLIDVSRGDFLFFRLTLLCGEEGALCGGDRLPPLYLGNQGPLSFVEVLGPASGGLCGEVTASSLVAAANPGRSVTLSFLSPTGFNSQGRQMPFPLPELVFSSLLGKWRRWIDGDAWPDLELCLSRIHVSRFVLKSAAEKGKNGAIHKGCLGRCRYDLSPLGDAERRAVGALADFAFYAGVGYKVGQGLGQGVRLGER